ncbi:hypothetical protein HNR16_000788 [Pseudoclavibacter chungangensis]|nr:hypothetical protein [Pseudoclavibacter chungangensis]
MAWPRPGVPMDREHDHVLGWATVILDRADGLLEQRGL